MNKLTDSQVSELIHLSSRIQRNCKLIQKECTAQENVYLERLNTIINCANEIEGKFKTKSIQKKCSFKIQYHVFSNGVYSLHFDVEVDDSFIDKINNVKGVASCKIKDRYTIKLQVGELFDENEVNEEIAKILGATVIPEDD